MKKRFRNLRFEKLRALTTAWVNERVDLGPLFGALSKKTVPVHNQSFVYFMGGMALFLFGLQVLTGALLMFYYRPSEATAHASVLRIATEIPGGWLIRSLHAWGADFFIALVLLHFVTILCTRAYRKPREMTWFSGVALLGVALAFGFSGYLLPWNERSYYATLVGTQIAGSVPLIGDWMVLLLRGSADVTGDTLGRFFTAHVILLPLGLGLLLLIHLVFIQIQGMSCPLGMPEEKVRDRMAFFSEFLLLDSCAWLFLFGLIVTLSVFWPVEVGREAVPGHPPPRGIKPEWYFVFMYQTLKVVPEAVGIALFAMLGFFIAFLPLLDRKASRGEKSPLFRRLFILLAVYAVVFQVWGCLEPGVKHSGEMPVVGPTNLPACYLWLGILWGVLVFMMVHLRLLQRENRRMRRLYRDVGKAEE